MKKILLVLLVALGLQTQAQTTFVTECDSYLWNGNTYTTTGIYTNNSTNSLNLTINYSSNSVVNVTCSDSLFWNGVTYTTSGVYNDTLINSVSCDSIVTLFLTVTNTPTSINESISKTINDTSNKMYDLLGRELSEVPIGTMYIKNNKKYIRRK